jgi:hypothetical protein
VVQKNVQPIADQYKFANNTIVSRHSFIRGICVEGVLVFEKALSVAECRHATYPTEACRGKARADPGEIIDRVFGPVEYS